MNGSIWGPEHIVAVQFLAALGAFVFMSILPPMFTSLHFSSSVSLGCVVGIACAIWPRLALREQSSLRRRAMLREFPFLLDMTTLCFAAGRNINGALAQAAKPNPAPHLRPAMLSTLY